MNRNYLGLIVVVMLVGLALTTMLASAQEAEPTIQWEYHVVYLPSGVSPSSNQNERVEAKLNELGQAGWELVGFEERGCIFKRPAN
ncbi:MAG: DUF4177 domain-containing protein [Sedimentisphaerales bacterium]|nr:DUF4177 domain-containing protein [Sedimentisphaerales bacterium]